MRRRHKPPDYPTHFISGYVRHRVPVFQLRPEFIPLFLQSLCFYREKTGLRIFGYVVIPDHYHLVLGFPPGVRVSDFLRDFKGYVGSQIVRRLKGQQGGTLLERFLLSQAKKRRRDPVYAVFQPDNDDRVVYSERFFKQKLNYVHNNPVRKGLVAVAAEYPWSSCKAYHTGAPDPIRIDPWA